MKEVINSHKDAGRLLTFVLPFFFSYLFWEEGVLVEVEAVVVVVWEGGVVYKMSVLSFILTN